MSSNTVVELIALSCGRRAYQQNCEAMTGEVYLAGHTQGVAELGLSTPELPIDLCYRPRFQATCNSVLQKEPKYTESLSRAVGWMYATTGSRKASKFDPPSFHTLNSAACFHLQGGHALLQVYDPQIPWLGYCLPLKLTDPCCPYEELLVRSTLRQFGLGGLYSAPLAHTTCDVTFPPGRYIASFLPWPDWQGNKGMCSEVPAAGVEGLPSKMVSSSLQPVVIWMMSPRCSAMVVAVVNPMGTSFQAAPIPEASFY